MSRHGATAGAAAPPVGLAARRAALIILDGVINRGEALDQVAKNATSRLTSEDAGLTFAICGEVLRWCTALDEMIDGAMKRPLPFDAKARMVLRIALAQNLRLGTAPHAVIATSLPLLSGGPKRLAHGVLGTLFRGGVTLPDRPGLPPEVQGRWSRSWGKTMAASAADLFAAPPPLDLIFKRQSDAERWAASHDGVQLADRHVRVARGTELTTLDGFEQGDWWVQDIAASLPARLLGSGNGRTALDLCAAPGGKTMQLVSAGWTATAVDISKNRLKRLEENLSRTTLEANVITADILTWEPAQKFDAILLDAPCTSTGIFRRHPDVLWRVGERQIAEMAEVQAQLLARASQWLAPGGQLVFATCSLEPQEGEQHIERIAQSGSNLTLAPITAGELPEWCQPNDSGLLRTLPGLLSKQGGCDGFFAARFEKQ